MAGLILREGADGLWYPVAFAAGFLALLLFVAAPMRRSGAYTVPDFAEARLASIGLRRLCTGLVLVIGWLYLLPQLQGAGLALTALTPLPSWTGVVAAGLVVLLTVISGGMRSVTFVQAFQYWLKLTAMAVPAVVVLGLFLADARTLRPAERAPVPGRHHGSGARRRAARGGRADPVHRRRGAGRPPGAGRGGVGAGPARGAPGQHADLRRGHPGAQRGRLARPPTGAGWSRCPGTTASSCWRSTRSCWPPRWAPWGCRTCWSASTPTRTAGPPGAPRCVVLAMVGGFFVLVTLVGALSRLYTPQLLVNGQSDAAVLLVPTSALGSGWWGWLLGGLVAAGAGAAFLSTMSGLVVSLAGMLFTDVLPGRLRHLRLAAVLALLPPLVLALTVPRLDFAVAVPMVLAVAASTCCPLLLLGIWWRGLTARGAAAGVLVGGVLCLASIVYSMGGRRTGRAGWGCCCTGRPRSPCRWPSS